MLEKFNALPLIAEFTAFNRPNGKAEALIKWKAGGVTGEQAGITNAQ